MLDPWGRLGRLEWLRDGKTILVKTYPEGLGKSEYAALVNGSSKTVQTGVDPAVTATVFRAHLAGVDDPVSALGPNNLNHLLGDLAIMDVEDGALHRLVKSSRICSYAVSPDGRLLAYAIATGFERPGSYQILADLFVYDLEKHRVRPLARAVPLVFGYPNYPVFSWSPRSDAIAYRTDGPPGTKDEVYVQSVDGDKARRVAEGPLLDEPLDAGRPLWDDQGRRVFFGRDGDLWQAPVDGSGASRLAHLPDHYLRMVAAKSSTMWSPDNGRSAVLIAASSVDKRMGLARIDLESGVVAQLDEENRWIDTSRADALDVTPDGRSLVFVSEDPQHPADLWLAYGLQEQKPRKVTHVAPMLAGLTATPSVVEWRGLDGDTLRGALLLPATPRPRDGYPLLVKVYGGEPISGDLNRFGFASDPIENLQVFASRGYAVLLADSKLRVGTPMLDLLKTVMPGVERVISLGIADPDRMGVIGHSYGGYSTLSLIVQTRRFKAAVARAGFGNLVGAYGQLGRQGNNYTQSYSEQGQGRVGGTLWEARTRYIENSPVFYLDRVTTPVLLIHGGVDGTVPPVLADEVFSNLRRLGKPVEYARYGGEDHWEGEWSLPNQRDYLTRVIAWFDRHLALKPSRAPATHK